MRSRARYAMRLLDESDTNQEDPHPMSPRDLDPGDPQDAAKLTRMAKDTDDDPYVHDVSDVILPVSYRADQDTGHPSPGTDYLLNLKRGSTARDAEGRHFRVLGPGYVQGSRILRDPDGRAFQADVSIILAPTPEDPTA